MSDEEQEYLRGTGRFLTRSQVSQVGYYWFRSKRGESWKIIKITIPQPLKMPDGQYSGPLENPDEQADHDTLALVVNESREISRIVDAWNSLGAPFPRVQTISGKRKASLKRRIRDDFWMENWQKAIGLVKESAFCRGDNERKWRADFDWFIRPDSVLRLVEGKYAKRDGVKKQQRVNTGEIPS